MRNPFTKAFDWFFGRGDYGVTVPAMDGALRPNDALNMAAVMARLEGIDNVICVDGSTYFSAGDSLYTITGRSKAPSAVRQFDCAITALACAANGEMAVALSDGRIAIIADKREKIFDAAKNAGLNCITAICFFDTQSLLICIGSQQHPVDQWVHDLMGQGSSGSVWKFDLKTQNMSKLADNLAWPNGLMVQAAQIFVSESWRHRIVEIVEGKPRAILSDLPGYPARMSSVEGGVLLCLFAPRSQLIEFVLRERKYCKRMMMEVPSSYWVAPAYFSGRSFLEPLQGGSVKQLGILKPWAPTRSYGLLIKLDTQFEPVASFHSRSGGLFHGITSAAVLKDKVLLTSRGADALLAL